MMNMIKSNGWRLKIPKKYSIEKLTAFFYFSITIIRVMCSEIGLPEWLPYSIYLLVWILFICGSYRRVKTNDVLYYSILLIAFVSLLISNVSVLKEYRYFAILVNFVPSYYFFRICNYRSILQGLKYASYFNVAFLLPYYYYRVVRIGYYDMVYSGWLIVPLIVLTYYLIKKFSPIKFGLVVIAFFSLFRFGTRGAFLMYLACVLYFLFCAFFFQRGDHSHGRFGNKIVLLLVVILLLSCSGIIIDFMKRNYSDSRTLNKVLSGNLFVSDGRTEIYNKCIQLISARPLGYGVLGSRQYINPYPHSILLELLLDYGVILGGAIFIYIIYASIFVLYQSRNNELCVLAGAIFFAGIGILFVTGSLYYEDSVPAIIALYSGYKKDIRLRKGYVGTS